MTSSKPAPRRNTKNIGFNEAEYETIKKLAKDKGLLPRQFIMLQVVKK